MNVFEIPKNITFNWPPAVAAPSAKRSKHENTPRQLRAMGSLFDGKYNQHVSTNYRGVFRT